MVNRKLIISGFFSVIFLIISIFALVHEKKSVNSPVLAETNNDEIILFYGTTCPHCKNVEEYMAENKTEEFIKLVQKEVFDNKVNSQLLINKARACGINTDSIGVPLLWVKGQCYSGDEQIINYFKVEQEKLGK
ncbi:MAG: hypothetical protein PHR00_02905 [Patescibacteria group bacterium]|nr:hypothetical protein [Patescibacteria group bacterium]